MNGVSQTGSPCYEAFERPITDNAARTYVILGVPRGGTSMVAGVARLCGLMLGDDLPNNHEDVEFNVDSLKRAGHDPIPAIKQTIERRNTQHTVWGWKYPRAAHYLGEIRSGLRDPRFVVVLRDPVASAGRQVRRHGRDPMDVIREHHQIQARNLDLVSRWEVPSLLVSYERSIDRPTELVERLAAFLGLPVPGDPERVRRFVQPGTYQDV